MSFRKQIIGTLVIQGLGAASVFSAIFLIGFVSGPEAQGLFSRIKSEIELIAAFSLFGMPQAVFFFLNSKRMNWTSVLKIGGVLSLWSIFASFVYMGSTHSATSLHVILFASASVVLVTHGMIRATVLAYSNSYLFNVVTALPQLLLFLFALPVTLTGSLTAPYVAVIFFASFAVSCLFAYAVLNAPARAKLVKSELHVSFGELFWFGSSAWLVAVLNALAAVLFLRYIEASQGAAPLGVFAMSLVLVQVLLTPFNYASPLLFKRWMDSSAAPKAARLAALSGVGSFLCVLVGLRALGFFSLPESMSSYAVLVDLKWPLAILAAAETAIRITAVATNAAGHPWAPAVAEALRLTMLAVGIASGFARGLESIVALWAIAAVLASGSLMVLERHMSRRERGFS